MPDRFTITNAQYIVDSDTQVKTGVSCTVDGVISFVPLDSANAHYAEILKQVDEGTITIEDSA